MARQRKKTIAESFEDGSAERGVSEFVWEDTGDDSDQILRVKYPPEVRQVVAEELEEIDLEPDFDPQDPKWKDLDYLEHEVIVSDITELSEPERRLVERRIEEEVQKIERVIEDELDSEDFPIEKYDDGIDWEQAQENLNKLEDSEELPMAKTMQALKDPVFKAEIEQKAQERLAEHPAGKWISGILNKLNKMPFAKELQAGLTMIAALTMLKVLERQIPAGISSERNVPRLVTAGPEVQTSRRAGEDEQSPYSRWDTEESGDLAQASDPGSEQAESSKEKETIESRENFGETKFVAEFDHSPKFKLNKNEAKQAEKTYAQTIAELQKLIEQAQEADAKDIVVKVRRGSLGVSMRRKFTKEGTKEKNIELANARFESSANPFLEVLQQVFPDIIIEVQDGGEPGFTIDGQFRSVDDAEEFVKTDLLRILDSGRKGNKEFYRALKAFDQGKIDKYLEKRGFTKEEQEEVKRILEQVQTNERRIVLGMSVEATRDQELEKASAQSLVEPEKPKPVRRGAEPEVPRAGEGPASIPVVPKPEIPKPEPPKPEPGTALGLLQKDKVRLEEYDATPQPDEEPGERPKPRRIRREITRTQDVLEDVTTRKRTIKRKKVRTPIIGEGSPPIKPPKRKPKLPKPRIGKPKPPRLGKSGPIIGSGGGGSRSSTYERGIPPSLISEPISIKQESSKLPESVEHEGQGSVERAPMRKEKINKRTQKPKRARKAKAGGKKGGLEMPIHVPDTEVVGGRGEVALDQEANAIPATGARGLPIHHREKPRDRQVIEKKKSKKRRMQRKASLKN